MENCELLAPGIAVCTDPHHRVSADGLLLARFATLRPGMQVVDLCAGNGLVGAALFSRPCAPDALVAVDIAPSLCAGSADRPKSGHRRAYAGHRGRCSGPWGTYTARLGRFGGGQSALLCHGRRKSTPQSPAATGPYRRWLPSARAVFGGIPAAAPGRTACPLPSPRAPSPPHRCHASGGHHSKACGAGGPHPPA